MRLGTLVLGLTAVFIMTTGYADCDSGGKSHSGDSHSNDSHHEEPTCGPCKIVLHLNDQCEPVSEGGASMQHTNADPRDRVCFINDTTCNFRLTFPETLFGADHTEIELASGDCVVLQVDNQAARKTVSYTIQCDCPGTRSGGSGNPDFNVGGGSGGGGSGGG